MAREQNCAIPVDEYDSCGVLGEAGKLELQSPASAVGYVGGMKCGSDVSRETEWPKVGDS